MKYLVRRGADIRAGDTRGQTPLWFACFYGNLDVVRWLSIVADVSGDVTRASSDGQFEGMTPLAVAKRYEATHAWLERFLQRRSLIAHWSDGRERRRRDQSDLGNTAKAAVWRRLPRQAMAEVLLLLMNP